jgi:hypothetical protein
MDIKKIVKRFDAGATKDQGYYCQEVSRPTKTSITVINKKLDMKGS